jgi:hypothetical protein
MTLLVVLLTVIKLVVQTVPNNLLSEIIDGCLLFLLDVRRSSNFEGFPGICHCDSTNNGAIQPEPTALGCPLLPKAKESLTSMIVAVNNIQTMEA